MREKYREMFTRARRFKTILRASTNNPSSFQKSPPAKKAPPRNPIPFLTDLKSTQDPAAALHLLLHSPPYLQDYPACSSLLYRLSRTHQFTHLHTLLHFIRSHRIQCKDSLFNAVIHHYGRARLPQQALEIFSSIPSFNCPRNSPSLQTFNHLLNALVDNDCLHQAHSLFSCSRSELGIRPNSVSYNILIKGRLKKDGLESALRVFDEMLQKAVRPSVVTYNIFIGFMSRNGQVDKAMGLKEEMVRKGTHPNAITYALLMEGLCLEGRYNAARKMMFDMEYQGCKTRLMNYGVLMSDCGRRGDFEEVRELLAEMKRRKLKPDVVIYSILINYLCANGRSDEAYKVLVEMQIKGCEPSAAIYRMMVDGFCGAHEFEKGLGVLNAMLSSGHCPRLETFKCLISGLCEGGRVDDACFVLEEMEKRKMRLDVEGWNALVDAICGKCDNSKIDLLGELTSMGSM